MKKLVNWVIKGVALMALALAFINVNTTCYGICYQPIIPESAFRFKKYK